MIFITQVEKLTSRRIVAQKEAAEAAEAAKKKTDARAPIPTASTTKSSKPDGPKTGKKAGSVTAARANKKARKA
ncbi:hypothetical protein HK100_007096 [Physocladia obscura]|uniref:Uncharacterized protein n=1 Tax=Physocladia obscura TaxID=109957 RepID=A0AAD5SPR6_9FUNG|nr:hypothetical protein HK100_007096 [Physocladia obscura]